MRQLMVAGAVLFAQGLALAPARAATVTVAVMPFKDLSGSSAAIGEAIRETVTTDLKDLSGVRVIERGNLDKILGEQNLQGQRADLDPSTAARVGKLLGANLICAGAFQKASPKIRLTARFIKVETGEIVQTAKVDGEEREFLKLQDKITSQLLKKAGLGRHAQQFEQRSRPPSKINAVELYGQSLLADNDDLKVKYLKMAVAEDANYTYAVNDLASLEKRMRVYESNADAVQSQRARDAVKALQSETDPNKYMMTMTQALSGLQMTRRYHQLVLQARAIVQSPPKLAPSPYPGMPSSEELAWNYMILAENELGQSDAVLRDGEKFLAKFPASPYFQGIKGMMDRVIDEKHRAEEARAALPKELADIPPNLKNDPCKLGSVYLQAMQYKEARDHYRRCVGGDTRFWPRNVMHQQLIECDLKLRDYGQARKDIAELEKVDPSYYRQMKAAWDYRLPVDG